MKEAELKKTIETYLQIEQNLGHLVFNRLNSGEVLVKRGEKVYKVNLCQEGTPDFIVHKLDAGGTFYLEVKGEGGKVGDKQIEFAELLYKQGVSAYVVKSLEDTQRYCEEVIS